LQECGEKESWDSRWRKSQIIILQKYSMARMSPGIAAGKKSQTILLQNFGKIESRARRWKKSQLNNSLAAM
jgi:hypothetical protein